MGIKKSHKTKERIDNQQDSEGNSILHIHDNWKVLPQDNRQA